MCINRVLDLLFPPRCPFCQQMLKREHGTVCAQCQKTLPWLADGQIRRKIDFADACFSPLAYRDAVPAALHRYKFSGVRAYAAPFGALMAQCLRTQTDMVPDLITWAPLSTKRLKQRGFDQAELLAQEASRQLSIQKLPTLHKTIHTKPQSGLAQSTQRQANARGVYEIITDVRLQGRRVCLIDDVVTSGATLGECAALLREAGAAQVLCLTLAQARGT